MSKLFNDIKDVLIYEQEHERNELIVEKLLTESYGSLPTQYITAKTLVNDIFDKIDNNEYIDDGIKIIVKTNGYFDEFGKVYVIANFTQEKDIFNLPPKYKTVSGNCVKNKDGSNTVTLNVIYGGTPKCNIATTMSHEIMHCFHNNIDNRFKDINQNEVILYNYLPEFISNSVDSFTRNFFTGLYCAYQFEVWANVSSISNFLAEYFKDRDKNNITTMEYLRALDNCDNYTIYENILYNLKKIKPSQRSIEYIFDCLTQQFKNNKNNNITLYNPKTFNVQIFISKEIDRIIKTCQDTIEKMHKNIVNFIENE